MLLRIMSRSQILTSGFYSGTMQVRILSGYHFTMQLTEEEIYAIITALMPSKLGEVMQYMKLHYNGLYNAKLASNVANHIIG